VEADGARVALTSKERLVLEILARASGAAVDADRLARKAGVIGGKSALSNTIYRLRAKLEDDPRAPRWLVSVPGIGYRLDALVEEPPLVPAQFARALQSLTDHVGLVVGLDDCVVYVRSGDELVQIAAYGDKRAEDGGVRRPLTQRLGEGLVGAAAAEDRPVWVPDVDADPRYLEDLRRARSELAVPVRSRGRVVGVLDSESTRLGAFDEALSAVFVSLAAIAAPAFERSVGARDA
jgi:putative methionine-R-sulfoxide reductase with GAF domain